MCLQPKELRTIEPRATERSLLLLSLVAVVVALASSARASPAADRAAVLSTFSYLDAKERAADALDDEGRGRIFHAEADAWQDSVRQRARFDLAADAAAKGDLETARRWWASVGLVTKARLQTLAGVTPVQASLLDGAFHLGASTEAAPSVAVELSLDLVARRAASVELALSSSGPITCDIDGTQVLHREAAPPHPRLGVDSHRFRVSLSAGRHRFSCAIKAGEVSRRFRLRVVKPENESNNVVVEVPQEGAAPAALASSAKAAVPFETVRSLENQALALALSPLASAEDCYAAAVVLEDTAPHLLQVRPNAIRKSYERTRKIAARTAGKAGRVAHLFAARAALRLAHLDADATAKNDALQAAAASSVIVDDDRLRARVDVAMASFLTEEGRTAEAVQRWTKVLRNDAAPLRSQLLAHAALRGEGRNRLIHDLAILQLAETTMAIEAQLKAAWIAEDRGDYQRARSLLGRVANVQPTHPDWLYFLQAQAEVRPDDGRTFIAGALLRLEVAPHLHGLASDVMLALQGSGDETRATAFAKTRTDAFPLSASAWSARAKLAHWRGDVEAAKQALTTAQMLRPQDTSLRSMGRRLARGEEGLIPLQPLDLAKWSAVPRMAGANDVGAEILRHQVVAQFFDNGLGTIEREDVIRITDATRAKDQRIRRYFYADGRETFAVLLSEHIRADGQLLAPVAIDEEDRSRSDGVYSDERAEVVTFDALRDGDILRIITREDLVGQTNLFGDFFGLIEPIGRDLPTHRWLLSVNAPRTREVAFGGVGAGEPKVEVDGRRQVFRFERLQIPRVRAEPFSPPYFERAPYLSISSYAAWEPLGEWYAALIDGQLKADGAVAILAKTIVGDAADDAEKVQRIYRWVVTQTRYVGIELGVHGWKPYSVEEILRRRFGDCKDKASLLISLLAAVDVGAQIVLTRTADLGGLHRSPPSMWAFNHAIAYVPSLDLYLDGTAEQSTAFELPALDQGATVLRVTPALARPLLPKIDPVTLATTPLSPASANANVSDYYFRLDSFGNVIYEGTERFSGTRAAARRRQLSEKERWRETVERELSQAVAGASVAEVYDVDFDLTSEGASYSFRGRLPRYARPVPQGLALPLSLYPHELAQTYADRTTRHNPLWFHAPWTTTNRVTFEFPAAARGWALPRAVTITSEHLNFSQTFHETSNGFRVEETTTVKSRLIPTKDYSEFRQAALAADRAMRRVLLLEFEKERR